jgi:DNA repair and recombination protein RAD54 and RAD54-like protein
VSALQGKARTLPLCESSREDVIHSVRQFLSKARPYDVLIVSYETFRIHAALFSGSAPPVDLLICDEAHRLKNDETKTNRALASLSCKRRVLLSGTPMQNHLDEVRPALPPSFPRAFLQCPLLVVRSALSW